MCGPEVFAAIAASQGSPAGMTQQGLQMQAAAQGLDALSALAAGRTRSMLAKADAEQLRASGQERAKRIREAGARDLSAQRAAATGAGVKATSDSALELDRDLTRRVEQDAGLAIVSGNNRAASSELSARYYRQAGANTAMDELLGAADKWRRSKYAMPGMSDRQINPAGDGVVLDPQAGW